MGMYTELFIAAKVKPEDNVIDVLNYMLDNNKEKPKLPNHDLFKTDRWNYMLTCTSYYFTPATAHTFTFDNITKTWCLISLSNFKNYDDEVDKFIDWILPYIDANSDDMIGYSRYEENKEPNLYYGIN